MIACIGPGRWGRNLIRNFYRIGALRLICGRTAATLDTLRRQYPGVDVSRSFEAAIRREDIQALAIATPAGTHFSFRGRAAGRRVRPLYRFHPPRSPTAGRCLESYNRFNAVW